MFILNFIKLVINFIIKMSSNNSFEIIKQFVQQQLANLMLVSNKEPENPSISDSSSSLSRSESSISELESTTTDSSRTHSDHSSAISISTDSQETIERGGDRGKKRRRKFEFLIIDEEKRCYTSDEIKSMNEYELIEAFQCSRNTSVFDQRRQAVMTHPRRKIMGIWLELGIFGLVFVFACWQMHDVRKAQEQTRLQRVREKAEQEAAQATAQEAEQTSAHEGAERPQDAVSAVGKKDAA